MASKFLLLLVLAGVTIAAYGVYRFLQRKIDARRSFGYFILFILVNLACIFILTFIAGFLIIHYKEFFFKR